MKRTIKVLAISFICILLAVCGSMVRTKALTSNKKTSFKAANDTIKVEQIEWNVASSINNGDRVLSATFKNNTKFTILDVKLQFSIKSDATPDQLALINDIKNNSYENDEEWADERMEAENQKILKPKKASDYIGLKYGWDDVNDMNVYNAMTPDILSVVYVGDDNVAYLEYYDYKSGSYSLDPNTYKIYGWPKTKFSKQLPNPVKKMRFISSSDEYGFSFEVVGCSKKYYDSYVKKCKVIGFKYHKDSSEDMYEADSKKYNVNISYNADYDRMTVDIGEKEK